MLKRLLPDNNDNINENRKNKFEKENETFDKILLSLKNQKKMPYRRNELGYGSDRKKINVPEDISVKNAKYLYETKLQGCHITPSEMDNGPNEEPCGTNWVGNDTDRLEIQNEEHKIEHNIQALRNINAGHSYGTNTVNKNTTEDISNVFINYLPTARQMANSSNMFKENKELIEKQIEKIEKIEQKNCCNIL